MSIFKRFLPMKVICRCGAHAWLQSPACGSAAIRRLITIAGIRTALSVQRLVFKATFLSEFRHLAFSHHVPFFQLMRFSPSVRIPVSPSSQSVATTVVLS